MLNTKSLLVRAKRRLRPAHTRQRTFERRYDALLREVDAVTHREGPIVAGPWRGDLGYELLFWIPLLRSLTRERPDLKQRLTILSRGGVEAWYADVADRYVDIFDLMPYEAMHEFGVREGSGKKGHGVLGKKQRSPTELDLELIRRAADRANGDKPAILEPRLAIEAMQLADTDLDAALATCLTYAPITAPPIDAAMLPSSYLAVRFYANPQLPRNDRNLTLIRDLVAGLASDRPVVLIETGLKVGGHSDFDELLTGGVVSTAPLMSPARNLAVQTAILARAGGFVGTYGGLSYLAPSLGLSAVGLYSNAAKINPLYRRVAIESARVLGTSYGTIDVTETESSGLRQTILAALG